MCSVISIFCDVACSENRIKFIQNFNYDSITNVKCHIGLKKKHSTEDENLDRTRNSTLEDSSSERASYWVIHRLNVSNNVWQGWRGLGPKTSLIGIVERCRVNPCSVRRLSYLKIILKYRVHRFSLLDTHWKWSIF